VGYGEVVLQMEMRLAAVEGEGIILKRMGREALGGGSVNGLHVTQGFSIINR
jgi:hypothetical protein